MFRRLWIVFICTCVASRDSETDFNATGVYMTYCPDNTCSVNASDQKTCSPCTSCSCEDVCQIFGTCCPDKQKDVRVYDARCEDQSLSTSGGSLVRPVYVVSGCDHSGDVPEIYRKACESGGLDSEKDPRLVAHQTLSGQTVFFKNKFCAYCYGIVNFDTLLPNLVCRKDVDLVSLATVTDVFLWAETSSSCSIGYTLPRENMTLPYCKDISGPLVSQCNVTGRWVIYDPGLESACRLYLNPLSKLYDARYKNIFCYICNGEDLALLDTKVACQDLELWVPVSLHILGVLNFRPKPEAAADDIISTKHPVCNASSAFDTLERKCKRLSCPDYYILDGQHCEAIFQSLPANTSFHINLLLLPNRTIRSFDFDHMFEKLKLHVLEELNKVDMTMTDIDIRFRYLPLNGYAEVQNALLSFIARTEKTSLQREVTEILLKKVSYNIAIHSKKHNPSRFDSAVIYGGKEFVVLDSNVTPNAYWEASTQYVTGNTQLLPVNPNSRCPLIEYDRESFEIISSCEIRHRNTNVTFNRTQYMLKDADIFLCVWQLPLTGADKKATREILSTNSLIMTITCMVVKCIGLSCLVLTFVTHCLFHELRSICGVNLMFLVSTLFVAHLMMMVGSLAETLPGASAAICPSIGIVLHFSWLTSFAWMSVCSFHMYKIFRKVAPSGANADYSCFYRYCLFSYGIPFLVVSATCVVMLFISNGSDIGYGAFDYHDICFIKSTVVAMITFVVPIIVNILHSFSFLFKAFHSLRKASKLRKSLKHKEMNVLAHCLKLSTLTGLSWVVAFVAKLTKQESLTIVFIILYCGQGIFIFFAFIFNRKVLKLYIKLFVALSKYSCRNKWATTGSNITLVGTRYTGTSKYNADRTLAISVADSSPIFVGRRKIASVRWPATAIFSLADRSHNI